jgi:hypothetical protein
MQLIGLLEGTLRRAEPEHPAAARTPLSSGTDPLWVPEGVSLSGLPMELLQQLRIAVQDGEKDRLDELIAAVANQDSHSARALKELADKYEYDTLTNLLTEAAR